MTDIHDEFYTHTPKNEKQVKGKQRLRLVPKEVVERHKEQKLLRDNKQQEKVNILKEKKTKVREFSKTGLFTQGKTIEKISFGKSKIKSSSQKLQNNFRKSIGEIIKNITFKDKFALSPYKAFKLYLSDSIDLLQTIKYIGNAHSLEGALLGFIAGHFKVSRKLYDKIYLLDQCGLIVFKEDNYKQTFRFTFQEYNLIKKRPKRIKSTTKKKSRNRSGRYGIPLNNRAKWYR